MEQQKVTQFNWEEFFEDFDMSYLFLGVGVFIGEIFICKWLSTYVSTPEYIIDPLYIAFPMYLMTFGGAIIYFIYEQDASGQLTDLQHDNENLVDDNELLTERLEVSTLSYNNKLQLLKAIADKLKAYKQLGEVEEIKQKLRNDANTIIEFNKTISLLSNERKVLNEKIIVLNNESNVLIEKHKVLTDKAIMLNDDNKLLKEKLAVLIEENKVLKVVEDNIEAIVQEKINKTKAGLISSLVRKGVDKNLLVNN